MVRNKWAEELIRSNSVCYEKPIELRSEKVRNIIGQVPPVFLRYGIVIISLSLLMLVGISAFIPYQPGINIEIKVAQTADGILHYSSQIPESAMKKRLQFTEVQLNPSADLPLPTRFQIESISDVVQFTGNDAWQRAVLNPVEKPEKNVLLQNPINVPGKILLEKQSVMMWVVGKVLCYNTPQKLDNKLRYDDERKNIIFNKKTYVHNKKKIQQRVQSESRFRIFKRARNIRKFSQEV